MDDYTIEEIEKIEGIEYFMSDEEAEHQFPLPKWYHGIRKKRISQLTDFDICRAIRQETFHEYIVPEAVRRLMKNPFAEGIFEGEMLMMLAEYLDCEFWQSNYETADMTKELVSKLKKGVPIPEEFYWDKEDEEEFYKNVDALAKNLGIVEL